MNKRILAICLALVLCLSLVPAAVFAESPLYTYKEIKTGVAATNVTMMGNGMCSFKTCDEDGTVSFRGVLAPTGKVMLTRSPGPAEGMMAGNATNETLYAGYGDAIVDLQRVTRYARYDATELSDTYEEGMNTFFDLKIYDGEGEFRSYVSDILARYEGCSPTALWGPTLIYFGNDGYLTVYETDREDATYAYIIDLQTLQVKLKQMIDDGSPLAEGEWWSVTSVNDGLIAYYHRKQEWKGTDLVTSDVSAGWMDINGTHKLSVDANKYYSWWNFSDGMAKVSNPTGMMYGYVDKTGKEVVRCIYDDAGDFNEGYAPVRDMDGRVGYIDKTGKVVISLHYNYACGYGDGLFTVGYAGQYDEYFGMVDRNDQEVVPVKYTDITIAKNGVAYAVKDGEIVILKFTKDEAAAHDVTNVFTDVHAGDWFVSYLQTAYDSGIVNGMTKDTFVPNLPEGSLTHGQILVMAAQLRSRLENDNYDFSAHNIAGAHWATSYLNYCKEKGITDDRYDKVLNKPVTRSEMAFYFGNVLPEKYYKDKLPDISFPDIAGDRYETEIMRLARAGIVGGRPDGTYAPTDPLSRAESTVFITNILNAMKSGELPPSPRPVVE